MRGLRLPGVAQSEAQYASSGRHGVPSLPTQAVMNELSLLFAETTGQEGISYALRPQQFLNFLPLPHGHGSFRPTFGISRRTGARSRVTSPLSPFSVPAAWAATARSGRRPGTGPGIGPFAVGAVGACSRSRNCGRVERKFSKACKLEVLRKRLCSTSFLMFAINSTNIS